MDALGAELSIDNSFKTADGLQSELGDRHEAGEPGGRGELTGHLIQAVVVMKEDIVVVGEIVEVIEQRTPELANARGRNGSVSTCGVQHVRQAVNAKPNRHIVPAEVFSIGLGLGGGIRVLGDPIADQRKGEREMARL